MRQPTRPTSRFGRATWHLHDPRIAVVLLALFAMTAPFWRLAPHLVRPECKLAFGPVGYGWRYLTAGECYVVRRASGFEVIDTDTSSWDQMSQVMNQRPQDVLRASCSSTVAKRGLWYPTRIEGDVTITLEAMPSAPPVPGASPWSRPKWPFSGEDLVQARAAYVEHLGLLDGGFAAGLRAGDQHVDRALPSGMLKDGGALLLAVLTAFSWSGARRYARVQRAQARLKTGVCGVCRYDLTGIDGRNGHLVCPECGAYWTAGERGLEVPEDLVLLRPTGA